MPQADLRRCAPRTSDESLGITADPVALTTVVAVPLRRMHPDTAGAAPAFRRFPNAER